MTDWTWIGSLAEWVAAAAAVTAVILAAVQLASTGKQLRETAVQAALDSEEQTRPYVALSMEPGLWGAGSVDLIVGNYGKTIASDIRMELDGSTIAPRAEDDQIAVALESALGPPFDLAPGARRRIAWRHAPPAETGQPTHGGPESGTLTAQYNWEAEKRDKRDYRTSYSFDLATLMALEPVPTEGPTRGGNAHDADKNLMAVLRTIAQHIGSLRR